MTWFQSEYIYRRKISLTSPVDVLSGHPVNMTFPIVMSDNGKIRNDLEDLEVVFVDSEENNNLIYREVTQDANGIYLSFNLQEDIESDEDVVDKYYLYYGNLNLTNQPTRPSGSISQWHLSSDHDAGLFTYTRPGEHWNEGVSYEQGSRASALWYVEDFRIISNTGFDKAIMEVQLDGADWEDVDLFDRQDVEAAVYVKSDLDATLHEVRVRVSGRKNPSSLGEEVNIVRVEYNKPIVGTDLGEEVSDVDWSSSVGGG